ncbi:unnamed protein product, partial [Rotaria sordida]
MQLQYFREKSKGHVVDLTLFSWSTLDIKLIASCKIHISSKPFEFISIMGHGIIGFVLNLISLIHGSFAIVISVIVIGIITYHQYHNR